MKYRNTLFFLYGFFYVSRCDKLNSRIRYYETIIKEQISSSVNYNYRTDASEFKPVEENEPVDFGEYDFIIVGGGSTGSVIANRLSEVINWKVLLLEAGNFGNDSTDMPALQENVILSDYNWGFRSVPQKGGCLGAIKQQCNYIRGQGLGGTSLLNGVAYVRANRQDFDKWELKGNFGWDFQSVLPYFKKSENFRYTDPNSPVDWPHHQTGGLLPVEHFTPRKILTNTWLKANEERGYKILDYNGEEHIGTGVLQKTTNHGKRADLGTSYLKPIVNRSNLRILTRAYVTKIIIEKRRAVGVKFTYRGKYYTARGKKEVILSAGAIGSPQILMLSGIGPQEHLKQVGIENIVNLQVGNNLRDQPGFVGLSFNSNVTLANQPLKNYIEQYLKGEGPLTSPTFDRVSGFYNTKSKHSLRTPDVEMLCMAKPYLRDLLGQIFESPRETTWQNIKSGTFTIFLMVLDVQSTGTVRLKSGNPFDYPLIDPNLLSDPANRDIDTLYEAVKLALSLVETKVFASINATLVKQETPACQNERYLSKDYWYCILRQFTTAGFHPTGTCRMGPNPRKGDVVDARNRVYGTVGLRVADASVIPFPLSGNPNAVCVMIGEKVADQLKLEYYAW